MARRRRYSSKTDDSALTLGVSPHGVPVHSVDDLPDLPLPKTIVVGDDILQVDGWHFRLWPMTKPHLSWLARQAGRWCQEDPSPENKVQVTGVIDAIESVIRGDRSPRKRT